MLRLAHRESLGIQRIEGIATGGGHGWQVLFLALGVDDVPLNAVHRHGIGGEEQGVVRPGEFRDIAEWSLVEDPGDAIHDVQHNLLAKDGMVHDVGDELVTNVGVGGAVRPRHVVDGPMTDILERAGDARGTVILEAGQHHQFVHAFGDKRAQV